jgi:hypothetical protein
MFDHRVLLILHCRLSPDFIFFNTGWYPSTQSLLMMLYVQVESVDMQVNIRIDVGKLSLDFCVLLDKDTGKKRAKKFIN